MASTEPTNARLVRVQAPGGTDTYDGGGLAGPEKWHGNSGVWYEERRDRRTFGQPAAASDVFVWRTLMVSADLRVDWQDGDVVTFRRQRAEALDVGTVKAVENTPAELGAAGEVLLTLETT